MRKINGKSIIVIVLITFYLTLSCFFLINKFSNIYSSIINPIVWIIVSLLCFIFFKNEYVNKKFRLDILQTTIITLIVFFIIYYLLGFIVGFQDTPYSHKIIGILNNLWSFGIIIFFQEYVRQVLINRSGRNKYILVLLTILFIFVDISKSLVLTKFSDGASVFQFFVIILNPAIARNMLLMFLTYKADFLPSLIYRFFLVMYSFIVPFIPNFNWFLLGVIDIVLPFITFSIVYKQLQKKENEEVINRRKYKGMLIYPLIFGVLMILVMLVSGVFKYQIIAIASNSMNPIFYKGDAVIIKKIVNKEKRKIKTGEIIVYNLNGSYIVHRVVEKKETLSGAYVYVTKGDNNNNVDTSLVEENQIIGKLKLNIKFIGYPTVLLQDILSKE